MPPFYLELIQTQNGRLLCVGLLSSLLHEPTVLDEIDEDVRIVSLEPLYSGESFQPTTTACKTQQ